MHILSISDNFYFVPNVLKQLKIKEAIHIDWEEPTTLNQELHH